MRKWTSVLAVAIAGALVATMAFAQSSGNSGGNTTAPQMPGAKQPDAGAPSASPATDADKSAPSASPSTSDSKATSGQSSDTSTSGSASGATTGSSDTGTSGGTKSDSGMKSDTMKSDTMKSDMSKGRGMRAARGGDREQVKAVQQALKDKGHDPGAVDGVMGPKTRSALRDFQKKEGIKDTGQLDQDTMSKLGVEARTSGISGSSTGTSASPATSEMPSDSSSGSASGSSPATPGSGDSGKKY